MNAPANSTEVARLYEEFSRSFSANDDEAVRHVYRELLRLGLPRAEIVDEAVRLAGTHQGGSPQPLLKEPIARAEAVERFGMDRIAQSQAVTEPVSDAVGHGPGAASSVTPAPEQKIGKGFSAPGARSTSKNVSHHGAYQVFGEDDILIPNTECARRIGFLLRSPIARLSVAFALVVSVVLSVLAFLPARSTADKAIRSDVPAAMTLSSSQSSIAGTVPSPALTWALPSGEDQHDKYDEASGGATKSDLTSDMAMTRNRPGQPEPNRDGSLATTPRAAESEQILSLSPPTSGEARVARAQVPAGRQGLKGSASPDVFAPPAASIVISPKAAQQPLSSANMAALISRGDSLLGTGDFVSARLFYERAANAGSGEAALRLGETYDPQFLAQAHLRGARGNIATAVFWYKRARDLGTREAEILLGGLPSN